MHALAFARTRFGGEILLHKTHSIIELCVCMHVCACVFVSTAAPPLYIMYYMCARVCASVAENPRHSFFLCASPKTRPHIECCARGCRTCGAVVMMLKSTSPYTRKRPTYTRHTHTSHASKRARNAYARPEMCRRPGVLWGEHAATRPESRPPRTCSLSVFIDSGTRGGLGSRSSGRASATAAAAASAALSVRDRVAHSVHTKRDSYRHSLCVCMSTMHLLGLFYCSRPQPKIYLHIPGRLSSI